AVRTPMQWSDDPNGGFSSAPPEALVRPVVSEGPFAYEKVNFDTQSRDSDSLLNFVAKLIRARTACPEIGYGEYRILKSSDRQVFGLCCEWEGGTVLAAHRFSSERT